jgi:hypothetical protein
VPDRRGRSAARSAGRACPLRSGARPPTVHASRPGEPSRGRCARGRLEQQLRALQTAREEYERRREADRIELDEASKKKVRELAHDFPRLWRDPRTCDRDRKRMVRLLLEDAKLRKDEAITVEVRFSGGATRSLRLPRPRLCWEIRQLPRETAVEIDRLLEDHTDGEVAQILNERGMLSGTGRRFGGRRVRVIRRAYELRSRKARLRARGTPHPRRVRS